MQKPKHHQRFLYYVYIFHLKIFSKIRVIKEVVVGILIYVGVRSLKKKGLMFSGVLFFLLSPRMTFQCLIFLLKQYYINININQVNQLINYTQLIPNFVCNGYISHHHQVPYSHACCMHTQVWSDLDSWTIFLLNVGPIFLFVKYLFSTKPMRDFQNYQKLYLLENPIFFSKAITERSFVLVIFISNTFHIILQYGIL